MAWRLAKSLVTLRTEIRAAHPGTTVWDKGDAAHASRPSDHNPNAAGVVCAIDVLGDKGLNLHNFSRHLVAKKHNCLKYVIYNRQIATRSNGWKWVAYNGSNPHSTHVHVSVGRGSDGRSTGPYDETTSWGISSGGSYTPGDELIGLKKGDTGDSVKGLQGCLRNAGFFPTKTHTIDGIYGAQTSAALLACRKSRGSSATNGDKVTGDAYHQLMAAQILNMGGGAKGPKGDKGDKGDSAVLPNGATLKIQT